MDLIISNSSGAPIYEQICSQIKGKIISGELKEGDALPSIRLLAKELRISVITTKRAYEELERDGFLVTYPGKGSFVAGKNLDIIREERLRQIEGLLEQVRALADESGLSQDELEEMFRLICEGD
ncbi:MAG TPA: GntR family transcriptional regulator [Candidatus Scatomorpha merdigallinarum]|nr:GntR family transcriptional regulator [Candidatus Scatomorpha merdigallinarum]